MGVPIILLIKPFSVLVIVYEISNPSLLLTHCITVFGNLEMDDYDNGAGLVWLLLLLCLSFL